MNFPFLLAATRSSVDWIVAGAIFGGAFVLAIASQRIVQRLLARVPVRADVGRIFARLFGLAVLIVGFFVALDVLQVELGPLLGALGFSGVVIAFALQGIIANFIGSMLLHARRPFRAGDQIESNGYTGTVLEVNAREVMLQTFDGTKVYLANDDVLKRPLHNLTHDDVRRTTLPFSVSYDTDLRSMLPAVTRAVRAVDSVAEVPSPEIHVTGFGDDGIELALRVWHPSEQLVALWVMSEVAITVLETLRSIGVEIPFPQRVLHQAIDLTESPDPEPADD